MQANLTTHIADHANPHAVTAAQIGAPGAQRRELLPGCQCSDLLRGRSQSGHDGRVRVANTDGLYARNAANTNGSGRCYSIGRRLHEPPDTFDVDIQTTRTFSGYGHQSGRPTLTPGSLINKVIPYGVTSDPDTGP